jgi:adenosine deaminase
MAMPTVLLHDHLDGGLRVGTILELAANSGYDQLPSSEPEGLSAWFDQSHAGSLETYLSAFEHTIALMQTTQAIERVAYEAAIDLAADGVVYVESRFCPDLHTTLGLTPLEVVQAVSTGFSKGASETGIHWRLIIDALRHRDHSMEMVQVAKEATELGVVAFDLAGPEYGFPPNLYLASCRYARESGLRLTIHAGESGREHGVSHIAQAMDISGAERLGHGFEIINDCQIQDGQVVGLGRVAQRVLDRQIALELCPSSNIAIGNLSPSTHPIGALHRAGFNVTLNTDNRLMSNTSMSAEFHYTEMYHGFTISDMAAITKRSLSAAFCDHGTKSELWRTIAPLYLTAGATVDPDSI